MDGGPEILPDVGFVAAWRNKEKRTYVKDLDDFAMKLHEAAHFRLRRWTSPDHHFMIGDHQCEFEFNSRGANHMRGQNGPQDIDKMQRVMFYVYEIQEGKVAPSSKFVTLHRRITVDPQDRPKQYGDWTLNEPNANNRNSISRNLGDSLQYITSRQHPETLEHRQMAVRDAQRLLDRGHGQGEGSRVKSETYVKQCLRLSPALMFIQAAAIRNIHHLLAKLSWVNAE